MIGLNKQGPFQAETEIDSAERQDLCHKRKIKEAASFQKSSLLYMVHNDS